MEDYVSKEVCEERKDRFEEMFNAILHRLDRMDKKLDKNSNGKLIWRVVGVMTGFSAIIIGAVAMIVAYVK